jgi:TRAP-type C4-dicarboxylate transport system permease small subunit
VSTSLQATPVSGARPPSSAQTGTFLSTVDRMTGKLATAGAVISALGIIMMMLIMIADVVARTQANRPISGAYETVEALLVLIVFLGLANTERSGQTVRVTAFTGLLPPAVAEVARRIGRLAALLVGLWLAYAAALAAQTSFERGEFNRGLIDFPIWPAKAIVLLGLLLLSLQLLMDLLAPPKHKPLEDEAGAL